MDLSIVIPVRNEEEILDELVSRVLTIVRGLTDLFEVVFVTDVNKDKTFQVLKQIAKSNHQVKVLKLSKSHGQSIAIFAGLKYAKGKAAVVMDGDLQDMPEDIPRLYDKYREGYDVVYGVKDRKDDRKLMDIFSKLYVKVINILSDEKVDHNTNFFRIISRRTADAILLFSGGKPYFPSEVSSVGYPTATVKVTSGSRKAGKTKFSYITHVGVAINNLISYSTKPLRIISVVGSLVFGLGSIYLVVTIVKVCFYENVVERSILVVLAILFGGLQLFFLGILGVSMGKIFMEARNKPLYIVEEKVGDLE